MKMLIPVDSSAFMPRVLDFVVKHRELLGAKADVTLITAVPTIPPHAARYLAPEALQSYYADAAEIALKPARETLAHAGIETQSSWCTGHPPAEISARAGSGGYELVVMGSRGHSALANMVLGSVVTGVLANSRTPVLVVR